MYSAYFDIDQGPTWRFIIDEKDTPDIYPYFLKAVAKRSYEELYNISSDPGCLNNLVGDSKYMKELEHLRNKMNDTLKKTEDARYLNSSDQDQKCLGNLSTIKRSNTYLPQSLCSDNSCFK